MNKNLKKIVLCMALSTSVLVSGNTVKYFNVIDTVKADENVTTTPVMTDPNNASIADAPFNKAGYALDPNTSRYTFGVWQFLRTDPNTKTKTNFDYYATLSVDRDAITGNPGSNPKVYLRIVKKSTGAEVYTRELNAGDSNISLPSYITNNAAGVTNTLTYVPANGPTPGTLTFSLVHANLEYETLQVRDTELPGNENEDKPNVQTTVPFKKPEQITYYREIDESKYTEGQPYKPTGDEEVITKYVQNGISGQQYVASDNRDIEKYERIEATTDNNQPKTGLVKHVAGQKLVELKGGANHYYVKRISEVVDSKGSTVTRLYALDPSEVDNFNGDDVGSTDVSKYTLLYTTKVNAPGEIWTAPESKVTKVNSKNGDYYIEVTETAGSRSLVVTGWFSKTEKVTYIADEDKQPRQYDKPFTKGPDVALTAAGKGNNAENVIAGKTTAIVAKTKVTQPDGSFTYIGLEGFTSFSNNYSIPTPPNGSTDVNYYFRKLKGEVEITYVDDKGNKIKDPKKDTPKSPYDTPYNADEPGERPDTIEKDGKTYKRVPKGDYPVGKVDENGHLENSDPIKGKVEKPKSTITYVYKQVGNVYVHYKDTEGNVLKASVTDMDKEIIDSDYDTVVDNRPAEIEKDGKTYVLVPAGSYTVGEVDDQGHLKSSDDTIGKVAEQDKNVTYIYKLKEDPKKGEVVITYVDENGNELKDPKQDTPKSPYDTPYDTTEEGEKPNTIEKDGKTYKLVPKGDYPVGKVDENGHLVSSDPITGKVDKPKSVITYVYKEVKEDPAQPKGNVYVHYKDTEGNELKASVKDMDQQPVDSDYDTVVDNRPNEIEKDGKTYVLVPAGNYTVGEVDNQGHLKSSDPTTGKVAEQDKNVTYIYKLKEDPKKGEVVITYVDENGNELKDPKQDTPKSPYDTPYDTTEEGEKPNTIEKDGKTYKLVPKGDYPVGKVDENGHLVSSDPITGKVDKPKSVITYVYKEVKEDPAQPKGNVYVHYKDTEGNELKASVKDMDQQPVDSDYDTVVDNRPNEIEKDGKTYVLVPAGNYTVGEVDNQGHLKSSDPTTGKVAEQDKNVTYIYKLKEDPKKGEVVITYVDENGNELKDPKQDTPKSPYDTPYDTTEEGEKPNTIEKDGKTYKLVPKGDYPVGKVDENGHLVSSDPITGKVDKPKSVITYVYKEVKEDPAQPKGNVYVHYKDTEGNELKASVKDMDQQPVDSDYDTVVDNRPNEIEKDGKTYVLVPAGNYTVGEVDNQGHLKSSDPTTGKVAEQDKNVTYIYKLKEDPTPQPQPDPAQPKGNVYVYYKDTEGNVIKSRVTDEDAQPVDKDYDTVVDNRPQEIVKDGKTYVLVPAGNYTVGSVDSEGHLESSDPTTGKVIEGDKHVTYIYKLKEEPVVPGKPGKPGEPGKPGDPGKGNRLPKTGVASSSALLSLVTVLTGAMGIVINSKKRK